MFMEFENETYKFVKVLTSGPKTYMSANVGYVASHIFTVPSW